MATRLDDKLKWTTGLFFSRKHSPNDGGLLYLFLPSAGSAPTAAGGKQITVTDWTPQQRREQLLCRLMPRRTYSICPTRG